MGAVGALAPTVFLPRPEIIHINVPLFLPRPEILYIRAPTLFSPVGRQCVCAFVKNVYIRSIASILSFVVMTQLKPNSIFRLFWEVPLSTSWDEVNFSIFVGCFLTNFSK